MRESQSIGNGCPNTETLAVCGYMDGLTTIVMLKLARNNIE